MTKVTLRKTEAKEFSKKLSAFGFPVSKNDKVEISGNRIILVNDKPVFFIVGEKIIPSLKTLLLGQASLKKVVVDMGAVRFVASGADVMRPGIVFIDDSIKKDELVMVVDEKNKKPLCVCISLFDAEEMKRLPSGKVLKNIHFVGDKIWQES